MLLRPKERVDADRLPRNVFSKLIFGPVSAGKPQRICGLRERKNGQK